MSNTFPLPWENNSWQIDTASPKETLDEVVCVWALIILTTEFKMIFGFWSVIGVWKGYPHLHGLEGIPQTYTYSPKHMNSGEMLIIS